MPRIRGKLEYQMVEALREIRADLEERGVSAAAWCRAARVSRVTLWRYLGETRQPSPRTFDALASAACAITQNDIEITMRIRMGTVCINIKGPT